MSPALPVPIVRRAPAAGLFGRKAVPGTLAAMPFPWEQLLFAPDALDAARDSARVIVRFPPARWID
jgi:hypothetical protein